MNELGGATRHPAHLGGAGGAADQAAGASLDPSGPILQLLDETYFLDPEGHWVVSTQSTRYRNSRNGGGDAPAPAHEGPEKRELPAGLQGGVLPSAFEDKPLCVPRQLAELLQLSLEDCADFDAMLRRLEAPWHQSSACGATPPCAC